MVLPEKFTRHPADVGESYGEHFIAATGFSLALLKAAWYCGVHAVLPFLYEKAGSECIAELHARMVANRRRYGERPTPADPRASHGGNRSKAGAHR